MRIQRGWRRLANRLCRRLIVVAGGLFFFGIPLLAYFTRLKTYARTEYRFFDSKLDYFEGFFTVEDKDDQLRQRD